MSAHPSSALLPAAVVALYPPHDRTIPSFLGARARVRPDGLALEVAPRRWTYGQLERASEGLARVLARRGIVPGDRIALISANTDFSVILFFAAARLGALFVPLNPAATQADLEYLLSHTRPALVVAQPADLERAGRVAQGLARPAPVAALADWGLDCASSTAVLDRI